MIFPIWRELEARFVRAAKAIEENDESLPGGTERNRQLNAAAQELMQAEPRQRKVSGGGKKRGAESAAQRQIRS